MKRIYVGWFSVKYDNFKYGKLCVAINERGNTNIGFIYPSEMFKTIKGEW